jgi:hypothetical protein
MSDNEMHHSHRFVHGIAERLAEHHEKALRRKEEEALTEAVENAAFDLGADISRPTAGHAVVGYDVEADLGTDKEPPELRSPGVRTVS